LFFCNWSRFWLSSQSVTHPVFDHLPLSLREGFGNHVYYCIKIICDFIVGKSQNSKSLLSEKFFFFSIEKWNFLLVMNISINFDDEFEFEWAKINDNISIKSRVFSIEVNRFLSEKFVFCFSELQGFPQDFFTFCHIFSQISCCFFDNFRNKSTHITIILILIFTLTLGLREGLGDGLRKRGILSFCCTFNCCFY
jgi:hypothetical protein